MSTDPDADLRALLQELREYDRKAAPAFEGLLPAAMPAKRHVRPAFAWAVGGCAVAIAVGLFVIGQRPATAPDATAAALPAWSAPTDFLLADAANSVRILSSAPSPTSDLGSTSFNHEREQP
jgi:hypothetical protein